MSFIDNILDKMGLSDDDYEDDFYEDEEFEDEEISRKSAKKSPARNNDYDDFDDDFEDKKMNKGRTVKPNSKVTSFNSRTTGKKGSAASAMPAGMEVCVMKPTTVEDAREITETLLDGKTVVLNLEGLDIDIAQRIIDFTSGSCFAISGNLQKISSYIFIITPQNVDIFGDFQDILNGTINVSALRGDI